MTLPSTDLSTTISLTTYKNGQCILRYETYSGNDQTCNYFKKKVTSFKCAGKRWDHAKESMAFRTLPHHWNSEFQTLAKLLRLSTLTEQEERMKGTTLKTKLDTEARGNELLLWIYRYMYRQSMDANGKPKHGTLNQSKVIILVAYGGSCKNQASRHS